MAIDLRYPIDSEFDAQNRWIVFRAREYTVEDKGALNEAKFNDKNLGSIALYLPNNFSEDVSQNWGPSEIFNVGTIAKKVFNWAKGGVGASIANKFTKETGMIANPSEEQLYNGPNFRNFSFDFDFIPKGQKELDVIKTILIAFKVLSLPKRSGKEAISSVYISTPCIWNIEIGGLDTEDFFSFGFKGKSFALTDVNTNYTPEGTLQQLSGGFPVHTNLRLTFVETEPLYRADFESTNAADMTKELTNMLGNGLGSAWDTVTEALGIE